MDGLIAYALSKKYVDGKTSGIVTGMSWKGTKENISNLPQSGNQVGDLWHVNEDGNEYAWDGSKWEALGGIHSELPTVTASDNGKVLGVDNGVWTKVPPSNALIIDWNNKYANAYNDAKAAMQADREVYLKIPNSSSNPTQCTWLQATAYDATYITFGGVTSAYLPEEYFIFTYAHITDGLSNWFKWSTRFYYNPALLKHLAPAYSSSATYSVGDYVTYGTNEAGTSGVYKCKTAIITPENWTAAHWTRITVMSQIASGGSAPFEIPITESGGTYSTTATAADILAHADNCVAVVGGVARLTPDYVAVSGTTALLTFAYIDVESPVAPDEVFAVLVENNSVTVSHAIRNVVARTLRVAMTAQDTAPTLEPNKLYVFPEMASLETTFATPTDNTIVNEYHFIFTSGATATTLTLPATILQPDGFTVEANHVYEISILENCMTAQGWAVASA